MENIVKYLPLLNLFPAIAVIRGFVRLERRLTRLETLAELYVKKQLNLD